MEVNESRRCLCNSGFVGSGLVCSGKKETGFVELLISLGIEEYDSAEPQIEVEAVNLDRRRDVVTTKLLGEREIGGGGGGGGGGEGGKEKTVPL